MIQKTVYFRTQDDLDKFNAIKNKAEWLHEHLNSKKITQNEPHPTQLTEPQLDSLFNEFSGDDPTYTDMEEIA